MVECNDCFGLIPVGKETVSGDKSPAGDVLGVKLSDRCFESQLFIPHEAVLSGVGIETANHDRLSAGLVDMLSCLHDPLNGELIGNLAQGNVVCDESQPVAITAKGHRD